MCPCPLMPWAPQVVKVRPNDKDAKLKYQECNKIVKQKAFERAIASDEQKRSVVDSLDIESMSEALPVSPPPPHPTPKSRCCFLLGQGRRNGSWSCLAGGVGVFAKGFGSSRRVPGALGGLGEIGALLGGLGWLWGSRWGCACPHGRLRVPTGVVGGCEGS